MSPHVKKCRILTLQLKSTIITEDEKGKKKLDVAEEYKIPRSSRFTVLKAKENILAALQNGVRVQTIAMQVNEGVDKAILQWFLQRTNRLCLEAFCSRRLLTL